MRDDDAGDRAEEGGDEVGQEAEQRHVDTGQAGHLAVGADEDHGPAQWCSTHHVGRDGHDDDAVPEDVWQSEELPESDRRQLRVDAADGGRLRDVVGGAARDAGHAEGHDDGVDPHEDDENAVDRTPHQPRDDGGENGHRHGPAVEDDECWDQRRRPAEDRGEGQVELAHGQRDHQGETEEDERRLRAEDGLRDVAAGEQVRQQHREDDSHEDPHQHEAVAGQPLLQDTDGRRRLRGDGRGHGGVSHGSPPGSGRTWR